MAANLATAAALLLITLAAPIVEASGSEQATDTALPGQVEGTRTRTRCTEVRRLKTAETCASVARAAGLSDAEFRTLNPDITCAAIFRRGWFCAAGTAVA